MKLFHDNGHLTQEALEALAHNQPLAPMERLELAEHLAFCDQCLQRYTDVLAQVPALTPEHSCRQTLWVRIRMRTLRLVSSRYAAAAAAVALALWLTWSGTGPGTLTRPILPDPQLPAISESLRTWSASLDQAMLRFNDFFTPRDSLWS